MVALTAQVKDELAAATVTRPSVRIAELATLIRCAGSVELPDPGVPGSAAASLTIELDREDVAQRVQDVLTGEFNRKVSLSSASDGSHRKAIVYTLHTDDKVEDLLRRVGLLSRNGLYVVGLPPRVVSGTVADAEGVWRGAFMARGVVTDPGRVSGVEVICPCPEVALALVGAARRLGIGAKTKESRGQDRVVVRDSDAVGALLTRMGAQVSRLQWESTRAERQTHAPAHRLANFDDANLRRSARAAVAAAARVERALAILGDDVPEHLAEAGTLRVEHRQASLEELGRLADPQMTKDAVAGRIRRLLSMADKRAKDMGIPDTHAAVTEELLNDV